MKVKLISLTRPVDSELSAEALMAYCARVSSPKQNNPEHSKLLSYCAKNGHWSVFEMADMTVEITTSRAISHQILRHRSFCFQEFSQRYAKTTKFEEFQPRRQDSKNRQNSFDDLNKWDKTWFLSALEYEQERAMEQYESALKRGIAKECARAFLQESAQTKLYMKGSIRSWIHYLDVRTEIGTQKEHRDVALECQKILLEQFPVLTTILTGAANDNV